MTGGPAKIIAGASGCMDLSRARVLLALAAATFRVGLIMERGFMGQGITWLWLRRPAALGWTPEMPPGTALEDVWI
jgi:hypothetical protein